MKYNHLLLLTILFTAARSAIAHSASIVGAWTLTADKLLPDGTRVADFGPNSHGLVIFTADGHYVVEIYRADRPQVFFR